MDDADRARIIKCWRDLDRADRLTVLLSDPEAVEQAWRELRLKPVPANGVDVARQARALRYAEPRDAVVRDASRQSIRWARKTIERDR